MISLLIGLLILLVVLYIVKMVIDALELPPKIRNVAMAIVGLIFLLILLNQLGFLANVGVR